jgi:membrane peptidoglycan carboxypeptidase
MLETGKITQAQYDEASKMPVKARFHGAETTLNALSERDGTPEDGGAVW